MASEVPLSDVERLGDMRSYIARFLGIRPEDMTGQTRIDDRGLPKLRELVRSCAEFASINCTTERGALALRTDDLTTVRELIIRIDQARNFPPVAYHNSMRLFSANDLNFSIGHLLRGGTGIIDQVMAEQCVRCAAEMQTSSEQSVNTLPASGVTQDPILNETSLHV